MKKLLGLLVISLTFFGCGNKAKQNVEATEEVKTEAVANVEGIYKGVLPAADCPGIETTLILNEDGTFVKTMVYLENEGTFEEKGTYTVEEDLLTLTLVGEESESNVHYLRIEENQIRLLNQDKMPAEGELAEYYVLKKVVDVEDVDKVVEDTNE